MNEQLQEFVSSRGVDVRVDSAAGIIRGVKLLGLESRNGRRYLPAALAQAAALYEGAKVNVNHPKGSPLSARDYQDRLGSIRGVRSLAEGLFGDLHYNPKHALAEQLAWDAVHAPENVGFSHNVEARTSRQDGRTIVEAILKVQSVDLVADPATTRSLFESTDYECGACTSIWLSTVTLESLRAARPDLVDAVRADAAAELVGLREEVDRLRRDADFGRRRSTALALFREFELPDPTTTTMAEQLLAGEPFLEAVIAAPDEPAMRRLVEERAQLIAAARARHSGTARHGATAHSAAARPVSREQQRSEQHHDLGRSPALDARSFARSIT
jgi:hypothetical protein